MSFEYRVSIQPEVSFSNEDLNQDFIEEYAIFPSYKAYMRYEKTREILISNLENRIKSLLLYIDNIEQRLKEVKKEEK